MKKRDPRLFLGDEELGTLVVKGYDMPWTYGSFSPLPAFDRVAPLFRLLQEALDVEPPDDAEDLHLALLEQVNRLDLRVRHPNGAVESIDDFKIEDGEFEYKTGSLPTPGDVVALLGPEHDTELHARLQRFVAAEGGAIVEKSYTVAGSQEIVVHAIALPGGEVEAVSETYLGLSLRGPAALVACIEAALRRA